jgi:capsular polysaccharide biosynthesis protein
MTRNPPTHEQQLSAFAYENTYEDEINLVDLWLVLMQRRALVMVVAGLCVLAGLAIALLLPAKYQYSTTIEIGTRLNGTQVDVIESPETLLAKVQESYIPLARQQYLASHADAVGVPKIEARIPKGSQIIVLSSKGPETAGADHKSVQQAVVDMAKKDHGRIVDVLRKETEILQNEAKAKLEELKDGAILIQAREKRLGDISTLLTSQAEEVRGDLARAKSDRARAIKQTKDESRALTLMMLDSGMQQYSERLAEIDERLKIKLVDKRDELTKQLADNRRAQISQQDTVVKLEMQLANLRETRALLPPMRSPEASGPGATLIVLLSLVLGLMLGVFAAFFAEFLAKVRSQNVTA